MLLSEAIDKFLAYQKVRRGRPKSTIDTYRSQLRQFLKHTGDIHLDLLTVELVDEYAEKLSHHKPKTLKNKLTPIRSMIEHFYAKGVISIRKEAIELPRVEEIEANFLSDDEQQRMIEACFDARERAVIAFLITSGLRVSEFISLRIDDVYRRSVLVRRGKGGKPRTTYITEQAQQYLDIYLATAKDEQVWLFPNEHGEQLSRQYIAKLVARVAKRAGLHKKVSPHTLRHTFATNLLIAGARAEDVQPLMGHSNIRTTQIYMHFTNAYLKERYDLFSKPGHAQVL